MKAGSTEESSGSAGATITQALANLKSRYTARISLSLARRVWRIWFKEFIDHRDPHLLGPPLRAHDLWQIAYLFFPLNEHKVPRELPCVRLACCDADQTWRTPPMPTPLRSASPPLPTGPRGPPVSISVCFARSPANPLEFPSLAAASLALAADCANGSMGVCASFYRPSFISSS